MLSDLSNLGLDYSYLWRNFNFFGELAYSSNGAWATINGFLVSLDPKVNLSIGQRYYQKDFQTNSLAAFAEGTKPNNERGLFVGASIKPSDKLLLTGYYDRFVFPWLRYRVSTPSYGTDYFAQLTYAPTRKSEFYVRYRNKKGLVNSDTASIMEFTDPFVRENFRIHLSYPGTAGLKFKTRLELISQRKQQGYFMYQDISYSPIGSKVTFTLRYGLFDTPGYDWRIYTYENEIPGVFSIPSFYYKGHRFYLLVNYNITRKLELWVKYSETTYANREIISEGSLNEIKGNKKSEVKVQLRYRF
jgi:hypothetical protein